MNRSLLVLALGAGLSASLHAQSGPESAFVVDWPLDSELGSFGRTEAARILPYSGQSLVMQWGMQLVLAYAPTVHTWVAPIAGVMAFAIFPAKGDEDRDRILVATDNGLSLLRYTTAQEAAEFEETAVSASCANAVALTCADVDHDGRMDIVAADYTGEDIHVLLGNSSGGFDTGPVFTSSGTVRELDTLDWSGDAAREIAVLSDWGTEVYDCGGTRLWWRDSLQPGHVMAVLPKHRTIDAPGCFYPEEPLIDPDPFDHLAVVQRNTPTSNELLSINGSVASESAILLGTDAVVAIDAGFCGDDAMPDLAVSYLSISSVRMLFNKANGSAHSFSSTNSAFTELVDFGDAGSNSHAHPCIADLDGDGAADLAIGAQNSNWVAVMPGNATGCLGPGAHFSTLELACEPPFTSYEIHPLRPMDEPYTPFCEPGKIAVVIAMKNVWGTLPSLITDLELIVWKQPSWNTDSVNSSAVAHLFYPLGTPFRSLDGVMDVGFSFGVAPPEGTLQFLDRYYVEARPVHYNPTTGNVGSPKSVRCCGFTLVTPSDEVSLEVLHGNPDASQCTVSRTIIPPQSSPNNFMGGYVGGLVPQLRIPSLPPLTVPYIPPPPAWQ